MRRRRIIRTLLLLLTCSIILIDCCCTDSLILGTNHDTINPPAARREMLQVDGRAVECWIARSPGAAAREPEAFVLFYIGKGDRTDRWINAVADAWGSKPVEVWGMNYPGSGGSEGPVSIARVGPDALAMHDAVKKIAGPRPIFIQAGSFGTTVALCVAARRPVAGLVLQNPPALRQMILREYGWWNLWLIAGPIAKQVPEDLDSLVNASHVTAPAIFILAGNDDVVPPKYHQMVVDAYAGPKKVITIDGGRHNDPLTHEASERLAKEKDWMWGLSHAVGQSNGASK